MTTTPRDVIRREAARLRAGCSPTSALAMAHERANAERRDVLDDALVWRAHGIAGPGLAGYPSADVGAAYVLGARLDVLAPGLTRREAGAWIMQSEHETPTEWLLAQARERYPELPHIQHADVIRWAVAALDDPERRDALMRTRTGRIGEREIEGRIIDRLDEIVPSDLSRSVVDTVATATQRLAHEHWTGPDELIPAARWHGRLPHGVTVLRTATALWEEGAECRHCVGVYAQQVHERECIIVRVLAADGSRSTAEVRGGRVVQHKGPRNAAPSQACVDLIRACRWS